MPNNTNRHNSSSEDENTSSDMDEPIEVYAATCLFCSHVLHTVTESLSHCNQKHGIDIQGLLNKYDMDSYGYIKLINYIRLENPDPSQLLDDSKPWDHEKYLKPHDPNSEDPWLWYDIDDLRSLPVSAGGKNYVNSENGNVTMTQEHFQELKASIQRLSEENALKDMQINRLKELIVHTETTPSHDHGMEVDDRSYFSSYSSPHIHLEMLEDDIRTNSFYTAIMKNKKLFEGKSVLDVGCGTGILSMMAASAGAGKVVGIDQSDIVLHAKDIVRANNLDSKVTLVKGKVETSDLPGPEKYDIIISEWMGYNLLFEQMLDSLIIARSRFLKEDGIVLPSKCSMYLVAASDTERRKNTLDFWDNVYGFDMSNMKLPTVEDPIIDVMEESCVVSSPVHLHSIDTRTCEYQDTEFACDFSLEISKDCTLTHLVGYFDTDFQLPEPVSFTTGPHGKPTHWKQTLFLLVSPIQAKSGDTIQGKMKLKKTLRLTRGLEITIKIQDQEMSYSMT